MFQGTLDWVRQSVRISAFSKGEMSAAAAKPAMGRSAIKGNMTLRTAVL